MRIAEVALGVGVAAGGAEGTVVELRREAVAAVVREQRLHAELVRAAVPATGIEQEAFRALERGQERLARQVLARGICTLKLRDVLEEEWLLARRRLTEVLVVLVRAENHAWGLQGRSGSPRARARRRPARGTIWLNPGRNERPDLT